MRIEVKTVGLPELKKKLGFLPQRVIDVTQAALYQEGELIMTEAKKECPVDTGTLRSSGYTAKPKWDGARIVVELGFGGAAAPYAVYVHERLDLRHTVGKAKYLEDPTMAALPELPARLSTAIRRELGR